MDDNGKVVAHYDYDAYGNQRIYGYHDNEWKLLEDTLSHEGAFVNTSQPMQLPYLLSDKDTLKANNIAYINPFRYRSYYYDTETNLYYLTSRYYDPETGRFINADDISYADPETINGLNLFAYCLNNPVMFTDPTGYSIILSLLIAFGLGALIGGITSTITGLAGGKTGWELFGHIAGGALLGGVLGAKWSWGNALAYGGVAAVQGSFSFGIGVLMGYSGNWNSLNKGQIKIEYKSARQLDNSIIKSLMQSTGLFIKNNLGQLLTRFYMKNTFMTPWSLIKLILNGD